MTARCNRIGFNAANRSATAAFCAILGGGGSLSASRAATRLAQQRNTAQLPRASSRSTRRFARHPARIVRALISAQLPRAIVPAANPAQLPRAIVASVASVACVPFPDCVACVPFPHCAKCAPMRSHAPNAQTSTLFFLSRRI